MSSKKRLIWLVGGGTGGHIFPLIAVAEQLKGHHDVVLHYIGESGGLEQKVARSQDLDFYTIPAGKLRRYITLSSIILNIRDIIGLVAGIIKSFYLIKRQKPSVIFSKGGPVALPVALAAALTKTPLLTHESDSVMGASNRLIARVAKVVFTGFRASHYPVSLAHKIVSVGIPLQKQFCVKHAPATHRPTLLVTGGSQGAVALNQVIIQLLPKLLPRVTVIHITGERSIALATKIKERLSPELKEHYTVLGFTDAMAELMSRSTLVIARAGASIFEIASMHKPMILIPLPSAANNHQVKNAEIFHENRAALVIRQESLTPDTLYERIEQILTDKQLRSELQEGTRHFSCCDASARVAKVLLEYAI